MEAASMVPEVLASRVLRTDAARVVSLRLASSSPRPVMVPASKAV